MKPKTRPRRKETPAQHGPHLYLKSWFFEQTEDLRYLFYYTAAGLRDLWRDGFTQVKFYLASGDGDTGDPVSLFLEEEKDTVMGPILLETDWGTLDLVAYKDNGEELHVGRLILR